MATYLTRYLKHNEFVMNGCLWQDMIRQSYPMCSCEIEMSRFSQSISKSTVSIVVLFFVKFYIEKFDFVYSR